MEISGVTRQMIDRVGNMSREFKEADRIKDLSWSHHWVVKSLKEPTDRSRFLALAKENKWTSRELRKHLVRTIRVGFTSEETPSVCRTADLGHKIRLSPKAYGALQKLHANYRQRTGKKFSIGSYLCALLVTIAEKQQDAPDIPHILGQIGEECDRRTHYSRKLADGESQ